MIILYLYFISIFFYYIENIFSLGISIKRKTSEKKKKRKSDSIKMLQQQHKLMVQTNLPSSMLKVRISILFICIVFF